MQIDLQIYFQIYLLGSGLVIILTIAKLIIFTAIDWFTKGNILSANLRKLAPPDNTTKIDKFFKLNGTVLLEALLSWINVIIIPIHVIYTVLKIFRELINSVPEDIKKLRYPLRNNPYLEREEVWAYVVGIELLSGHKQNDFYYYEEMLNDVVESFPNFNRIAALSKLESLNVLTPEMSSIVKNVINNPHSHI